MRDYLQRPYLFYRALFESSDGPRPARELADILGLAESTVNKYARERESDEAPSGTGARSDLERFVLTLKHFGLTNNLEECQALVSSLQQLVDDEINRRAALLLTSDAQRSDLKARALEQTSRVALAVGLDRDSSEILREQAAATIAVKLLAQIGEG